MVYGNCLKGVWWASGGCLAGVLWLSGGCLKGVWKVSYGCLAGICGMFQWYSVKVGHMNQQRGSPGERSPDLHKLHLINIFLVQF